MQKNSKKEFIIVPAESAGLRLDNFLSEKFRDKSRSHLQKLIESSLVMVNEKNVNKNHRLSPDDIVEFTEQDTLEFPRNIKPQEMALKILYQDEYYLIISKDAGISVHPSPGSYENTLVNALLFHLKNHAKNFSGSMDTVGIFDGMGSLSSPGSSGDGLPDSTGSRKGMGNLEDMDSLEGVDCLDGIGGMVSLPDSAGNCLDSKDSMRPGIVHRLDKDTSGLIIVAKDCTSQYKMAELFKKRQVEKTYVALVAGSFNEKSGKISLPVGRSRIDRKKMAVCIDSGRSAVTDFEVMESFKGCTLLKVYPKTGRTHQIRVHLNYIDHPVIGDLSYGNSDSAKLANVLGLSRQFLHAQKLTFCHPYTNKKIEIEDELADDLKKCLEILKKNKI